MTRLPHVLVTASLALLAFPATGAGQASQSDPDVDSPSGHVYAIPLESARSDATPRKDRGDATKRPSTSGGGTTGSSGSGTEATEDPAATGTEDQTGTAAGSQGSGSGGGTGGSTAGGDDSGTESDRPSPIRSENGFGSSSQVPGLAADQNDAVRLAAARAGDPAGERVYGLLALGILLAVGVGVASRFARRST